MATVYPPKQNGNLLLEVEEKMKNGQVLLQKINWPALEIFAIKIALIVGLQKIKMMLTKILLQ